MKTYISVLHFVFRKTKVASHSMATLSSSFPRRTDNSGTPVSQPASQFHLPRSKKSWDMNLSQRTKRKAAGDF